MARSAARVRLGCAATVAATAAVAAATGATTGATAAPAARHARSAAVVSPSPLYATAPSAVASGSGALQVFDQRSNDHLEVTGYSPAGGWGSATDLGGTLESSPFAINTGAGTWQVFVVGPHSNLYTKRSTATATWVNLGGTLNTRPAAAYLGGGNYMVFARGSDGALWMQSYAGNTPRGWHRFGGNVKKNSGPAATTYVANGSVHITVAVRGPGDAVYVIRSADAGRTWTPFASLGGVINRSPGLSSPKVGWVDAFVLGPHDNMWSNSSSDGGATWHGWVNRGGALSGGPGAAASRKSHATDVFVIGQNSGLYHTHNAAPGGSFSPWALVP